MLYSGIINKEWLNEMLNNHSKNNLMNHGREED